MILSRELWVQSEKRARRDTPQFTGQVVQVEKNPLATAGGIGDEASIPRLGRTQYSCLEHPTDRGAWWATGCKDLDMTEATQHIEKDELKDTEKEQTEKKKETRNDNIQAKQKSISRRKESSKLSMLIVSRCKQTKKAEALHSLAQTHTGSKCCFSTGGPWGLGRTDTVVRKEEKEGKTTVG